MNDFFREVFSNQSKYISKRVFNPDYFDKAVKHIVALSKLDNNLDRLENRIVLSKKSVDKKKGMFFGLFKNKKKEDYVLAFLVALDIIESLRLRFVVDKQTNN